MTNESYRENERERERAKKLRMDRGDKAVKVKKMRVEVYINIYI